MKALTWHGKNDIRCETVPDPTIQDGRDAIIKVTACAICGSDLHLFDGVMPSMEKGDVLGHETMGEVVEVGADNKKLKVGERVVVPFTISCGECFFCKKGFFSGCERSNPNHKMAEKLWGHSPAGLFGYSHMLGGYSGGQAEYLRVPYADVGPIKVPQASATSRSCSCPTYSRPASWPPISAISKAARRSPCEAVVPWVSLRLRAHSCWAPNGLSPSIPYRRGWRWRRHPAR
jgi:threonine dehydrogenase-like Zn-dependent dehydrogenase